MKPPERDLLRIVLAVLFIGILSVASLLIIKPFLLALTWATMIVVTTWPLMLRVQRALGSRRWLAVATMGVPCWRSSWFPLIAAITTVVDHGNDRQCRPRRRINCRCRRMGEGAFPGRREPRLTWRELATADPAGLARQLKPYSQIIGAGWPRTQAASACCSSRCCSRLSFLQCSTRAAKPRRQSCAALPHASRPSAARARCISPGRRSARSPWAW
jgi:hypothetical protein